HELVKQDWINELKKLNDQVSIGRSPSTRRFNRLDFELEGSQLNAVEKKAYREELLNKIEAIIDKIFNLYPDVLDEVRKRDVDLHRFKESLRQLRTVFYKSKIACFHTEYSRDIRTGIRFYLEGRGKN